MAESNIKRKGKLIKYYVVFKHRWPIEVIEGVKMLDIFIKQHPEATYQEYPNYSYALDARVDWIRDNSMKVQYTDGGRSAAGYPGRAGDCAVRSIAIATGIPYRQVHEGIMVLAEREGYCKHNFPKSNPETGVRPVTSGRYLQSVGFVWVPQMSKGKRCSVHLRKGELPNGRLVVAVSGHLTAVIDGVIHDDHDCGRDGTRCLYGYFIKR